MRVWFCLLLKTKALSVKFINWVRARWKYVQRYEVNGRLILDSMNTRKKNRTKSALKFIASSYFSVAKKKITSIHAYLLHQRFILFFSSRTHSIILLKINFIKNRQYSSLKCLTITIIMIIWLFILPSIDSNSWFDLSNSDRGDEIR